MTTPSSRFMKVASIVERDGDGRMELMDTPTPSAGSGEILVKVAAFGVNNADLMALQGTARRDENHVPGLEASGTVVAVGACADHAYSIGDRVGVLLRSGAYGEYVIAPAAAAFACPDGVDDVAAAALPEALAAAWWNLVDRGRIGPGDRVLVRGGAGGMGTVMIQLAAALGAVVTTTARDVHASVMRELGAANVVDHSRPDAEQRLSAVEPDGFDVIIDNLGGPWISANLSRLAFGGRLVVLGAQAGDIGEISAGALMAKCASVSSSSLSKLSDLRRALLMQKVRQRILPWVATGKIRAVVSKVVEWPDIDGAIAAFSQTGKLGKVVVAMPDAASAA